jgi:hypothetical protein
MRALQDALMTLKKTTKPKKITGVVSALSAKQIRIDTSKGEIFQIKRTPTTKVKVISGKPLGRGSRVTVEFNTRDGRLVDGGPQPGKRTETGTVIGLTAQLITLDNTSPDPRTWAITRTTSTVVTGVLTGGSKVTVQSNDQDWAHLA